MVVSMAAVFVLGIFMLAYAQSPEGAKPQGKVSIDQRKAKIISAIDGRINSLQELKGCVSAAQTQDDLRKCRAKFEQERKELWEERKEQRGK